MRTLTHFHLTFAALIITCAIVPTARAEDLPADPVASAFSKSLLADFDPSYNPALAQTAGPPTAESQPETPSEFTSQKDLQITVTGGVWFPRLGGTSTLKNAAGEEPTIDFETDFFLRDRQYIPLIEVSILKNQTWQIDLTGFWTTADNDGEFQGTHSTYGSLVFDHNDPYSISVDINSFAVQLSYWGFKPLSLSHDSEANLWFSPLLAMRYLNVTETVRSFGPAGGVENQDNDWFAIMLGPQMHFSWECHDKLPIFQSIDLDAYGAAGPAFGDDFGAAWQIKACITARFPNNFEVSFGYRLLELNVHADDYTFDAGLQGLFLSASWRF
ncbi:MAG TPA: hypothetical protein VG711_10575 [Phycisphaerales bacterium]|nr:hypothetical protein [Phycisphaerales bacterium]